MVVFKDFTVEVRSGGVELPTFDDPDIADNSELDPNTTIKYIQASANAEFSVYVNVSATYALKDCDSMAFDIHSDGQYLDGRRWLPSLTQGKELSGLESRDSTGRWSSHPLRFGPLTTCTLSMNVSLSY